MTTLFEQTVEEVPALDLAKEYLPDLVGEGKKFKTPEDLAKGKIEADAFIERLKREQAELRQDLQTRIKYEEFLDKMNTLGKQTENPPPEPPAENKVEHPAITEQDIADKVKKVVADQEIQKKYTENLDMVKTQLLEKLGPDYAQKIAGQARSLGLTQKDLDGMAASSPKAFLQLFGLTSEGQKPPVHEGLFSPPKTQVNSGGFKPQAGDVRTAKYYRELRAKDPKAYHSPKISNEMHAQALKLGEAFFD